ncbi:hypothetical protein WA026_000228 [Henosepilachna vigintioctopunctata]|uniref:Hexosyltransferase n=1 Tax=Henosepilachna vigintioctopunctata TaxID=420089 RepID=A0AAW1V547_9CUCU
MAVSFSKRKLKIFLIALGLLLIHLCGGFLHLFAQDFDEGFDYPYNGNVKFLVDHILNGAKFTPKNTYNFAYKTNCSHKCNSPVKLLFLVKSAPNNYIRRDIIRQTWGSEKQLDGRVRTVFLIGERASDTIKLNEEADMYNDLVQGNFSDTYFNNTLKTMMGFYWAYKFCLNASEYFMFVDDDYYVSPKNVLTFAENPFVYPGRDITANIYTFTDLSPDKFEIYGGYVFESSPFRSYFSKWYVPLDEYSYNKWPPYVTAGAYVLSRLSLKKMYYASLFTKHFRFDDIYVGILAYKLEIKPIHNENFHFHKPYDSFDYKKTIASHGFDDPKELLKIWKQQNA